MKRAWMLLLAVIALVALMTIPAMAAETHEHTTALEAGAVTISQSGTYYLEGDTAVSVTVTGGEVTICLNGKAWTNGTGLRPLTITGGTVNIVDCSAQSPISEDITNLVSSGSIQGLDWSAKSQGTEAAHEQTKGGAIYMSGASAVLNLYNGTIFGGKAYSGGNIYTEGASSQFNIYGGHITGGVAREGGNVYCYKTAIKIDGNNAVISDGRTTRVLKKKYNDNTADSDPNGGNLYSREANIEIKDGLICNGGTTNTAGNVRVGAVLTMHGGTVKGGYKITEDGSGNITARTLSESANMQIVGAKSHVLTGGTISGYVSCAYTVSFTVSGDVVTAAYDEAGKVISGIYLHAGTSDGKTYNTMIIVGEGGLGPNAKVAVHKTGTTTTAAWPVIDKVADAEAWAQIVKYVHDEIIAPVGNYVLTYEPADADRGTAEAIYVRNVSTYKWHCICGANAGELHIGDCDGYDVQWTKYEMTKDKQLPDTNGRYFLVDADADPSDNKVVMKQRNWRNYTDANKPSTAKAAYNIWIDFNGVTLVRNNGRFGDVHSLVAEKKNFLLFTDSSPNHAGGILSSGKHYKSGSTTNYDHSNVWVRDNSELNCYRINLNASGFTNSEGSGFVAAAGTSVIKLYGCNVIGGTAATSTGSALRNAGTMIVVGGSITGLSAVYAGAVYNSNTLTMTDVEITGGTVTKNGGAIWNKGTITLTGVDITGGTADLGGAVYSEGGTIDYYDGTVKNGQAREGGNFYLKNCTLNMISNPAGAGATDARKIQNGIAQASGSGVRGGNIRLEGTAVVKLQGVEVSGGQATQRGETKERYAYGGNIYMSSGTTLELLSGTKVTGGKTSSKLVTTTDGKEKESNMWSPGGNIMMDGGSLTITDAEISGAECNSDGQNLYINSGATAVMNSGKIECSYDGHHSIFMQGGNFTIKGGELLVTEGTKNVRNISSNNKYAGSLTIEGGTISGGNVASGDGGNIRLCAKIRLTITGGTISGGKAPAGNGGNIYLQGSATSENDADNGAVISDQAFTLSGGTIKDGEAKNGGNIFLGSTGDMTMTGGNIQDGTANGGAGNLYMLSNSSLVMSSGIISGGFTNGGNGGNVYSATGCTIDFSGDAVIKNGKSEKNSSGSNGNGANLANYGTLTMTGGSILQEASNRENWEGDGGNVYMNSQGGRAILKGGTINGWFFVADYSTPYHYPTITLGGNIKIKNDSLGEISLYLRVKNAGKATENEVEVSYPKTWAMITIDGLTADAEIGLTCQELATGEMRVITTNAATDLAGAEAWQSCFYNDFTGNVIGITADNKLFMAKAAIGATVSGGDICYEMPAAIAKAGQNGMIQLQSDYNGEMTIPSGVWVDLNGKTLAGKVIVTDGKLHLLDSVSADYNLEQDENKNYIYGKLTATVNGGVEDSFTTMEQNGYKDNHRYIVLVDKDEDGNKTYHAHRIYLAVKGVVLYPQGPHLRYHTEFKCDQVVAKDAKYGVQISGIPYGATEAKTSTKLYSAAVAGTGESNSRIAGLTNILVNEDEEVCNYLATLEYTACGYISVNGQEFTSASYTTTLKKVVEGVDKMWGQGAEGVTETIKPALVEMYETYADIMGGWELTNIKAAAEAAKKQ